MMNPDSERFCESEMSKNVDVVLKVHQDMYNLLRNTMAMLCTPAVC